MAAYGRPTTARACRYAPADRSTRPQFRVVVTEDAPLSRTRLSGLLAIPLLSASLLLTSTPALALGTLDQSVNPSAGSHDGVGGLWYGQTFTAGLSGFLDTVGLVPATSASEGYAIEIHATTGGLPSELLAST